jgi:CHASE3 domain sensor protein
LLGKLGIAKSTEAQQAWEQALLWVLHFDEDNQKAQHVKNEERIAKRKEEAAKNKIEKQQEKDQKAAEDAVKIDKGW